MIVNRFCLADYSLILKIDFYISIFLITFDFTLFMIITDTHCHLYSEEFAGDIDDVLQRAEAEGVQKFYLPGIDSTAIDSMMSLEQRFPGKCFAMMGLHPCSVKENYKEELEIVEQWLAKRSFAAVGEIGLDYYWDKTYITEQAKAFSTQIEWSIQYGLPISIHTRNAMAETIQIVKRYVSKGVRGIFHCFSGSYEQAVEIINAGFYLGIGGVLTYKNAGLAEILKKIELKHLVLETDAPYLTPAPFRGKRNESSYLKYILAKLAEVKACSLQEIAAVTTANAENIFFL
ncbi:MAG: TatD family deoxyribonuclease [Ferruginibacter sp.]|nr:TatD family deoxyribonuclease [Ferruginibacter sp.]